MSETSPTLGWNPRVAVLPNLAVVLHYPTWVTETVFSPVSRANEPQFVVVRLKGAVEALELKLHQLG